MRLWEEAGGVAKKSFKDNPAVQFITNYTEPETETEAIAPETETESIPQEATATAETTETTETAQPASKPVKQSRGTRPKTPRKRIRVPGQGTAYVETRSRRLQLLIQPGLYDLVKARAVEESASVNDIIHYILEEEFSRRLRDDGY